MLLEPLRYTTSIFCPNTDLAPTPEVATKLITAFAKYELIPTTFHEMSAAGPIARLRIAKVNSEWAVSIGTIRVDVEQRIIDKYGSNMSNLEAFCVTATDLIGIFVKTFPRKATRLAFATRGLLPDASPAMLAGAFQKLSTAIPYYAQHAPFEWSQRAAGVDSWSFNSTTESLNVITNISRARGVIRVPGERTQVDRIGVEFDINTVAEARDARFLPEHLPAFLARVVDLRTSILAEIGVALK